MQRTKTVRIGVIGVGGMGSSYIDQLLRGEIERAQLTAVCDTNPARLARQSDKPAKFTDSRALIRSGLVDAVMVVTPHYGHTTIGIDALKNGLHVLVDKPISVHKADCERLLAAHQGKRQVFAAMFNQRTNPVNRRIRELLQAGELGQLLRINWIVTTWFRSEAYYASRGWRATWGGEGGGVLLNQCPHQLDLMQWFFGMPSRVTGFCRFGLRHDIEVEDEVTAYLEYPNGASGVLVTSTGEAPGTDRLEITGEQGKLIVEGGTLRFVRNEVSCLEFSKTTRECFATPPVWHAEIPVERAKGAEHCLIVRNFVDAIIDQAPLIASAHEGIRSVELGNAMLLSAWLGKAVDLPLSGRAFAAQLRKRIRTSRYVADELDGGDVATDMSKSFQST